MNHSIDKENYVPNTFLTIQDSVLKLCKANLVVPIFIFIFKRSNLRLKEVNLVIFNPSLLTSSPTTHFALGHIAHICF